MQSKKSAGTTAAETIIILQQSVRTSQDGILWFVHKILFGRTKCDTKKSPAESMTGIFIEMKFEQMPEGFVHRPD